ncbi:hypothetical protein Hanom_Chr01g00077121 [Helianthus anomalus]
MVILTHVFSTVSTRNRLNLPGYFIPYLAAQDGPIHSGNKQFDFIMNTLLSMNMVVTLFVAIILDNTVLSSQ